MKRASLLMIVMAACGQPPEHDIDRLVHVDGPAAASCTGSWLARDGDGAMVRFDALTGAVVARAEGLDFRDVAVVGDEALALRQLPHGVAADVLDLADGLGSPETAARAAEADRIAPVAGGVLFLADSRWTFVGPAPWERDLPAARSLWSDAGGLHAWAGSLVTVDAEGAIDTEELALPSNARVAPFGSGLAAAWVDDEHLHLSLHEQTRHLHVGPGAVADLLAVDDLLAVLLASPTRLVVIDPVDMAAAARELDGSILSSRAFGRSLNACTNHVLLVATTAGLEHFEIEAGPVLRRRQTWPDLHAPVAGPLP